MFFPTCNDLIFVFDQVLCLYHSKLMYKHAIQEVVDGKPPKIHDRNRQEPTAAIQEDDQWVVSTHLKHIGSFPTHFCQVGLNIQNV